MYNVVFRTIKPGSTHMGVITWSSFESKAHFEEWNNAKMKSWYRVVEEGVSQERAVELCSTPEATSAVLAACQREMLSALKKLDEVMKGITG